MLNNNRLLSCLLVFVCLVVVAAHASDKPVKRLSNEPLSEFAAHYFERWSASQKLGATSDDIERYLSLLKADVGQQHLPYSVDDSRRDGALERMREGMNFYLGSHSSYKAELLGVMVGLNVVILKYASKSSGVHPQTKALMTQEYTTIEVLELEDGKVSVIRKYSE